VADRLGNLRIGDPGRARGRDVAVTDAAATLVDGAANARIAAILGSPAVAFRASVISEPSRCATCSAR